MTSATGDERTVERRDTSPRRLADPSITKSIEKLLEKASVDQSPRRLDRETNGEFPISREFQFYRSFLGFREFCRSIRGRNDKEQIDLIHGVD